MKLPLPNLSLLLDGDKVNTLHRGNELWGMCMGTGISFVYF